VPAIFGALALLPLVAGFYAQQVAIFALVDALLAISLAIVAASGQVSLAQSGFFAVGAYAAALLAARADASFWETLPASGAVAAVAGLLVGLLAFRVRRIYAAFLTFMVAMIVADLSVNLRPVTGGTLGMGGIPRPRLAGHELASDTSYFYLVLLVTLTVALLAMALARSRAGYALTAVREDESVAQILGLRCNRLRISAFAVSGFVAGVAGCLYAHYVGFVSPEAFQPFLSLQLLVMVVIGGMYRVDGAILGALLVAVLPELLQISPHYWTISFGLLLIATVAFFPGGLVSQVDRITGRLHRGRGRRPEPERPPRPRIERRVRRPAPATGPLLRVEGVSCRFGGVRALERVSFAVPRGTVYGVTGRNGAGKTALLNVVSGFHVPNEGTVALDGVDVTRTPVASRAAAGVARTFQEPRVVGPLTVLENVMLAGEARRPTWRLFARRLDGQRPARAAQLIRAVGLAGEEDRMASSLSYGKRKLLALANALRADPVLLLLDEPLAGVEGGSVERVAALLADECRTRGVTVVLVDHDLELIRRCCDRVLLLEGGAVLAEGPPDELLVEPEEADLRPAEDLHVRLA
jgi:branched-chain amino acid transport system ATP-binding protein/branched-chain amino acid transport system permease protein